MRGRGVVVASVELDRLRLAAEELLRGDRLRAFDLGLLEAGAGATLEVARDHVLLLGQVDLHGNLAAGDRERDVGRAPRVRLVPLRDRAAVLALLQLLVPGVAAVVGR